MKLATVLVLALATATFAQEQPASATSQSTDSAQGPKTTSPELQIARLHVYRPPEFAGSALFPSIYVDGRQVVRVGNGRCVTIRLTPGSHNIKSDDKGSAITLDARAGQDYFVRVDEVQGMMKGKGKVTMVPAEQGAFEYNLQRPIEANRVVAAEMVESGGGRFSLVPSAQLEADITRTIHTLDAADHPGCDFQVLRELRSPDQPGVEHWDVKSCDAISSYNVEIVPSPRGGSDFRAVKIKSVVTQDKTTDTAALPQPNAPTAPPPPTGQGLPEGFVLYEGSNEEVTIGIPKDWTAYDQGQTMKALGIDRKVGDMIIFYQSKDPTSRLLFSPELMAKVDTGEVPSFFLQKLPAEKGMSCAGFSEKAKKKLVDIIGNDPHFKGKNALEPAHAEPTDVGGCKGLRVRAKRKSESGSPIVADAYMASDGQRVYVFSLRNPVENFEKNEGVFQQAISTLKFSVAK